MPTIPHKDGSTSHIPTGQRPQLTNIDASRLPQSPIQENVELGIPGKPQVSALEGAYQWVANLTKGLGGLFSYSTTYGIDYARLAPSPNAKPDAVLSYINQLKVAKLSDREMTKCLNRISAHAAANRDIEKEYKSAVDQMTDPIWKSAAHNNLTVKKQVLPTLLSQVNVPKHTPATLRSEFFAIANIQSPAQRRRDFTALAIKHVGLGEKFENLKLEYLRYAKELKSDDQKRDALAPFAYTGLNSRQFDAYIDVVQTMKSNHAKADCLAAVAKYYPNDARFMEFAQLIKDLRATSQTRK